MTVGKSDPNYAAAAGSGAQGAGGGQRHRSGQRPAATRRIRGPAGRTRTRCRHGCSKTDEAESKQVTDWLASTLDGTEEGSRRRAKLTEGLRRSTAAATSSPAAPLGWPRPPARLGDGLSRLAGGAAALVGGIDQLGGGAEALEASLAAGRRRSGTAAGRAASRRACGCSPARRGSGTRRAASATPRRASSTPATSSSRHSTGRRRGVREAAGEHDRPRHGGQAASMLVISQLSVQLARARSR